MMSVRRQLSIRARLTLFFEVAIAVILAFTGVALVSLVHHTLVTQARNEVEGEIVQIQQRLSNAKETSNHIVVFAMQGDVVIQVTNLKGTRVWAASSAIVNAPVLAHQVVDSLAPSGVGVQMVATPSARSTISEISGGISAPITTQRGPGLIFGFVYGEGISHSVNVLLASILVSFPLLLLISGGLIWFGIGLALAPVESIRRRVDAIAAQDLTQRVPVTGGDDEIARMARTVNAMLDRLESSSQFQQEFVSNASHELRSPLTTLLATTERAAKDPSKAHWPDVVDTVMREGRRLDVLIDELFWLARMRSPHSPPTLISTIYCSRRPSARARSQISLWTRPRSSPRG
jgi:signal transduction histidine kinase